MMLPFASSSSSTTVSQFYDVFMSFRGEDTRMTFTSHLYDALIENGIITYKDDRTLGLGKPIAPELLQAIETSKIAVVILSRQYATSKWCLQELEKIVDCMKLGKLIVIPIFYHVTPSDVRHQSDCFEQAFSNHDANTQIVPGKVNMWRDAFKEVGALSGLHVTKDKDEAKEESFPTHGYEKLSDEIVKLAGGLPLALNVYGSLLCGKDENYWKDTLKKLREYPVEEVLGRLEVVYARLDKNQRNAFIYIACFLKGRNIDLVKDILTNIGLYAECGITDLINKCLITINLEENVWMHDLLQQMCWKILRTDEKHIAIKSHEDTLTLNILGAQTVEVINQDPYKGELNERFMDPTCFSKMTKLKFVRISNVRFPKGLKYLSNDLRILEWYGCSLRSFPSMFEPKHIYELEMCSSQLKTLWKKDLVLPNLRSINLSFSKNLTKIPDLTSASNLVKLNLEGCTNLTRLHPSVLLLQRLRYLNLKGCTCLKTLGRSSMEMEALEALLLSGCSKLEYIPEFGKNMKRLEHLYVDGTRIEKLPENMDGLCDLRNLDASGTFVKELPSSIYCLKKLRLLHVNRCRLTFKTGCFLNSTLSSLKELDLSNCNLSVVPDGVGLLCQLITLDLSGNEFVSLPASVSLLSKLRMLCLNNCKRLRSLPKLSLVDEDMDYGPRSRFSYYVSAEGVDVSKFHASSYDNRPSVSCLNCPKLAVDKRGSYLAEKILNSYLQLRTKYWMTPEALFEIAGAGSQIPLGFVQPRSGGLFLEGPWIGVAICAVISVHHIDSYMEAKYIVTAHIHLGEKHWKIPVPIHFLVAESETQLVFYWTVADDLQRIVGSSQKSNFGVSFSMEPEDGNLQVTKFGVRFINKEYILHLKRHKDFIEVGYPMVDSISEENLKIYEKRLVTCKEDTHMDHHIHKLVDFISDHGRQHGSLDAIYQITKGLLEINQGSLGMTDYHVIHLRASVLYNDFVQSVKVTNDGWLSVKLALEQILVKNRAGNYSYKEMLQQLDDLEAAKSVGFSDKFINMLESMFRLTCDIMQIFGFLHFMAEENMLVIIIGIFCTVAAYMGDLELLEAMKQTNLKSLFLHLIRAFNDKIHMKDGEWFIMKRSSNYELQISEFNDNGILLQELMNKMGRSSCFTKENEEEMVSVLDRLQKNIHKVSCTIEDMSRHSHQYSHDLEKAKKHVKCFFQFPKYRDIISMLSLFN
ncbi:putative TIR domain, P-loop containing nucleoside triphosphate hydrolase [Helianthus annuus]|nr:putative TIR domain, P-loop containing nucleoside triphosphate hydrolase [Helianthus annuus]